MNKKIQILLTTYNGEKYLEEQLDSYINLNNFEEVKVLVRDDGSSDGTLEILRQYEEQFGFEVIEGINVGINNSIMALLEHCDLTCEYFALSDQDDVWLNDKLIKALENLELEDSQKPLLFASCSQVVDSMLRPMYSTIIPAKGVTFYNAMIQNVTPGHTQVFNRKLVQLLLKSKNARNIHVIDWWIYLVASGLGQVCFTENYTVKHRQHGKNAVGYQRSFIKNIPNRIERVIDKKTKNITKQLKDYDYYYGDLLENEYKFELVEYFNNQKNFLTRLGYIIKTKTYRQTLIETIIFKVLYLFGIYNE